MMILTKVVEKKHLWLFRIRVVILLGKSCISHMHS